MPLPKARKNKRDCLVAKISSKISNCIFCSRSADDEVIFGKLYDIGDISCHYFCALLSSCLIQSGDDEDGLFGFLYSDIVAEAQRGKKYKCSYCSRGGATLGCNISQCKKQFHLPCGRENNAVSLFYGNYKSFCEKHAPKQKIPVQIMVKADQRLKAENKLKRKKVKENDEINETEELEVACVICYEAVPGYPTTETFWPSCCRKDAWFHRTCLQRMSLASGMHYLKCPLCNDKDDFYRAVLEQGYYVPDRDAAWELEANAFAEIYERPAACTAAECRCCLGREHDADSGIWELKLCLLCGSSCVHGGCLSPQQSGHYVCTLCQTVEPPDLDKLAATAITAASTTQGEGSQTARRGPPVPARMSLRRTKRNCNSFSITRATYQEVIPLNVLESSKFSEQHNPLEASSSKEDNGKELSSTRLELNLKTPKRFPAHLPKYIEDEPLKDLTNILSPTKVIEDSLKDKIMQMDIQDMSVIDTKNLIEEVREKFKKPQPLSAKRKVVSDILENILNKTFNVNPKIQDEVVTSQTDAPKLSDPDAMETKFLEDLKEMDHIDMEQNAPKEDETANSPLISNIVFKDECNNKNDTNDLEQDEDTKSTFELPSEFIAECNSDVSLEAFETPKKLKTVSIDNNSSIEISERSEGVNIDVFKIHTEENIKTETKCGEVPKGDAKSKKESKCTLKISLLDEEVLHKKNLGIDLEVFKSQYLNEVDRRSYKCAFSHRHEQDNDSAQTTIRSVIDFAIDAAVKKYHTENSYDIVNVVKDRPPKPTKRKYGKENEEDKNTKVKLPESDNKKLFEKTNFEVTKIEELEEEAPCDMSQNGDVKVGPLTREKVKRNKYLKKIRKCKGGNTITDLTKKPTRVRGLHEKREKDKTKNPVRKKKLKIRFREKAKVNNSKERGKASTGNENKKMLKQTLLVFSSKDKVLKSPIKMKDKRTKSNTKSPDNLKQMSLDSFFVLKIPI